MMPTRRRSRGQSSIVSELEPNGLNQAIDALTERLARTGREPAGGPVAAAVAALAAALASAAADRSRGNWDEAGGARAQAEALRRRLLALAERDAAAYAEARAALAGRGGAGGGGSGGGGGGDARLGEAVRLAAVAPLEIGAGAADVAELAAMITRHGAGEIQADAAIAAVLAAAAARAAAHLVEINLVAGADPELVAQARERARTAQAAAGSVAP